jgi:hypothetical protein
MYNSFAKIYPDAGAASGINVWPLEKQPATHLIS